MPIIIVLPDDVEDVSVDPAEDGSINIKVMPRGEAQPARRPAPDRSPPQPGTRTRPPIIIAPLHRNDISDPLAESHFLEELQASINLLKRSNPHPRIFPAHTIEYPRYSMLLSEVRKEMNHEEPDQLTIIKPMPDKFEL